MLGVNYEHQILNPETQFPNMEMDPNLNPNSKNFNTKNSTIHFYIWHSGFWILDSGFLINIYYLLYLAEEKCDHHDECQASQARENNEDGLLQSTRSHLTAGRFNKHQIITIVET